MSYGNDTEGANAASVLTLPTAARLSIVKLIALAALLTAPFLRAATSDTYPLKVGAAWYPEQWPESRWDADLSLMEQAHMHASAAITRRVGAGRTTSQVSLDGYAVAVLTTPMP